MIAFILVGIIMFIATLAIFMYIMPFKNVELSIKQKIYLYPLFALGYTMDVIFQLVYATIIFVDLPRETTFTSRMKRYKAGKDSWRKTFANKMCDLLNKYDEGHC